MRFALASTYWNIGGTASLFCSMNMNVLLSFDWLSCGSSTLLPATLPKYLWETFSCFCTTTSSHDAASPASCSGAGTARRRPCNIWRGEHKDQWDCIALHSQLHSSYKHRRELLEPRKQSPTMSLNPWLHDHFLTCTGVADYDSSLKKKLQRK